MLVPIKAAESYGCSPRIAGSRTEPHRDALSDISTYETDLAA